MVPISLARLTLLGLHLNDSGAWCASTRAFVVREPHTTDGEQQALVSPQGEDTSRHAAQPMESEHGLSQTDLEPEKGPQDSFGEVAGFTCDSEFQPKGVWLFQLAAGAERVPTMLETTRAKTMDLFT